MTEVSDILFELDAMELETKEKMEEKMSDTLAAEEKSVYDCISLEPISMEELIIKLDKPVKSIQYILTYLEIYGYIQKLPGQRYIRAL